MSQVVVTVRGVFGGHECLQSYVATINEPLQIATDQPISITVTEQ